MDLALRGPGLESHLQSVCGLCEGGCGLTVRLVDGLPVGLKGNVQHPLNRGGLCPVGKTGLDVLYAPNRVQGPLRRADGGGRSPISWDEALTTIGEQLASIRASGGGRRIVFLNGEPGQVLDDLLRHFMAALGSPNYAQPLDPTAVAYGLTQGLDRAPGFDLGRADLVLSFGQDVFEEGPTPIHAISAMIGSRPDGEQADLIHVGTRLSPSASKARLRVAIRPGTHGAFALGVAQVLVREGRYDSRFVADHTFGFEDPPDDRGVRRMGFRRQLFERYYPDRVAQICGCTPSQIIEVARRFGEASSPLAMIGGEAVKESNATWNTMAVHSLNALSGAFNRPGGVVLPPQIPLATMPTLPGGPPNAADSLFAGGLGARLGGRDPIEALADGVLDGTHPVDVLFVLGWNPILDSPAKERLADALSRIPMVVALTPFLDETAALADLVLPTNVPLESWHCATTPATVPFGILGVGSPVVDPLFDTRHPGDVFIELGQRVDPGSSAFSAWPDFEAFIRYRLEGLALAGQGSVFKGSLEEAWVGFLEDRGWRFTEGMDFETLWGDLVLHGGWWNPTIRDAAWSQTFRTPSGKFEFWSQTLERDLSALGGGSAAGSGSGAEEALQRGIDVLQIGAQADEVCFPHHEAPLEAGEGDFRLVTFRPITARGGLGVTSAMLMEMFGHTQYSGWETWAEISPETAGELGLNDGDIIEFRTEGAAAQVVLRLQPGGMPGVVYIPIGLGRHGDIGPAGGVGFNPVELLTPMHDPLSGALVLNGARGQLRLVSRRPHGGPAPLPEGRAS
ncbi:MAG: molybdopterin-dependent oxidoreductase [Longimicrobiales bacterium]|nr:molybdopterin-dependent oxidoreductase [Longimicrobiales bacterium]